MASEHIQRLVETAAWQANMIGVEFGARDDARLAKRRHPHGLSAIELGILKRGDPDQFGDQRRRDLRSINVDSICKDDLDRLGHRLLDRCALTPPRRSHLPGLVGILVIDSQAYARGAAGHVGLDLGNRRGHILD